LQTELMVGWAEAASEIAPQQSSQIQDWLSRRLAHIAQGRSRVTVCHEDLAAWPPLGQVGLVGEVGQVGR
jgi:hypothetical protein